MLPAALLGWHFSWLERCIVWSQALAICSSPKLCFPSFSPNCTLSFANFIFTHSLEVMPSWTFYLQNTFTFTSHQDTEWWLDILIIIFLFTVLMQLLGHTYLNMVSFVVCWKKQKISFLIRPTTWFLCMWTPDWICLMLHICFGGISWARMLSPVSLVQQQPQPIAYLRAALPFACGPGRDN